MRLKQGVRLIIEALLHGCQIDEASSGGEQCLPHVPTAADDCLTAAPQFFIVDPKLFGKTFRCDAFKQVT